MMAGRLQLIEQKLKSIDPAGFQNLCDAYLILREEEYSSINRTGSQLGKQKTRTGTPDSFIRYKDGKLDFIEYTTQSESVVKKLKDDIDKCEDESKTGVAVKDIHQIVICYNSTLKPDEEQSLQKYAQTKELRIELIGIDTLALEIQLKYPALSKEFLDIPIETGQILSVGKFISEYNNKAKQLSTPLDNVFVLRQSELKDIKEALDADDLIILAGDAGIGKTKLAIEATNQFLEINDDYTAFVIAKKDIDIFEDLRTQIRGDKNYLLLIDDANRQLLNLQQIFGFYKELRTGNLKLILTVRTYALNDILKECSELQNKIITIKKFSDDEIIQIISSDSFKIPYRFQKKIVSIADGNVRLAVMAARLAVEKQADFLWEDVSDLFDSYFDSFLADFDLFEDKSVLQALGIISFFFTLPREDKSFTNSLLESFEIDYYSFNEAIEELYSRELIEVQYDHARISEQVLATYFFYKVFIKEGLLPFRVLLFNYFSEWKSRFKDSIIPANNSFGYGNVISKIQVVLLEYLAHLSDKEKETLGFLDLFWFYLPEVTLSHFHKKTFELPIPTNPKYYTDVEDNDWGIEKDQTLDFLSRFFNHMTEWFSPAIELAFEYTHRRPDSLPELIKKIQESLFFDESDEDFGFKRQIDFVDLLIKKYNEAESHYVSAFFAISKFYLNHTYQVTHGGRKNTITFYDYPLPDIDVIKEFRQKIWDTLFASFNKYPEEVFDVIKTYVPNQQKYIPALTDFDLNLLIPFIDENFKSETFRHAHYINELIYWSDRDARIGYRGYRKLKSSFATKEYKDYCVFVWDRIKDRHEFEFNDIREYDSLKTEEIEKSFQIQNEDDFDRFFTTISNVISVKENNRFNSGQSIDIIIQKTFIKDHDLGFALLKHLFSNYPPELHFLYKTVSTIANKSSEWCKNLWLELEEWENENALFWKTNFFLHVPDQFADNFYKTKIQESVDSIDRYAYLYLESYERFANGDKNFIYEILKTVTKKIDELEIVISFSDDIFAQKLFYFNSDFDLIKKCYYQQYRLNHSQIFDFKGDGFEEIYKVYPHFLLDYLREFHIKDLLGQVENNIPLNFIWSNPLNTELLNEAFDLLIDSNPYLGLSDHTINILFKDLDALQKENSITFIKKYLIDNSEDEKRIDMVFEAIRKRLSNQFEEMLLFFLKENSNPEIFKKIDWVGNAGVQMGNVIFGEIYAKKWENILAIVKKADDTLAMIPIIGFIKEKITYHLKSAEGERRRMFLLPEWQ